MFHNAHPYSLPNWKIRCSTTATESIDVTLLNMSLRLSRSDTKRQASECRQLLKKKICRMCKNVDQIFSAHNKNDTWTKFLSPITDLTKSPPLARSVVLTFVGYHAIQTWLIFSGHQSCYFYWPDSVMVKEIITI